MGVIRRVSTVINGLAGGSGFLQMYFTNVVGEAGATQTAVGQFWQGLTELLHTDLTGQILAEQDLVEDTTGQIVGTENTGADTTIVFNGAGEFAPSATQMLCRWRTDTFIAGRRLQGRSFIPGITEAMGSSVPGTTAISTLNAEAASLISDTSTSGPLRVFSRTHLTSAVVTSGSAWNQYAVLRSRRD